MLATVIGRGRVPASASPSTAAQARNLPSTNCQSGTGSVSTCSRVPLRRSSLQLRMVSAALRKISSSGIHSKSGAHIGDVAGEKGLDPEEGEQAHDHEAGEEQPGHRRGKEQLQFLAGNAAQYAIRLHDDLPRLHRFAENLLQVALARASDFESRAPLSMTARLILPAAVSMAVPSCSDRRRASCLSPPRSARPRRSAADCARQGGRVRRSSLQVSSRCRDFRAASAGSSPAPAGRWTAPAPGHRARRLPA
jgi:hypothetical protein